MLGMELGEGPLVLGGLLETRVFHNGPTPDDLLGLGVWPVDTSDLTLADDVVHRVLRPVETATVEEDPLAGPLTDVLVHRIEQRLWRRPDALFHPHESHESGHVDHSFWSVVGELLANESNGDAILRHRSPNFFGSTYEHRRTGVSASRLSGRRCAVVA